MSGRVIKVLYIDEVAHDREIYSSYLSQPRKIVFKHIPPPPNLDLSGIAGNQIDLFLIDYQLSKGQKADARINYQGGTLATAIRERHPEYPIVALTRKDIFSEGTFREARLRDLFDSVIYKGEVVRDKVGWSNFLWSIGVGFRMLRGTRIRTWNTLTSALGANEREKELLLETGPPVSPGRRGWRVVDVARWLRDVLFEYPGILYNTLHAATLFGIDQKAFLQPRLQQLIRTSNYAGILPPKDDRWWRDRLIDFATKLTLKHRVREPTHSGFAVAYEKEYGDSLRRSRCIFSGEEPADAVCYILKEPVKREYSLPYYPDDRPPVMDEARVSFKAIRESNMAQDEKFGVSAAGLLRKIRRLDAP